MKTKSIVDIMRQRERICDLIIELQERLGGETKINLDEFFGNGKLRERDNQLKRRYEYMQSVYITYYLNMDGSNVFNNLQIPMEIYRQPRVA